MITKYIVVATPLCCLFSFCMFRELRRPSFVLFFLFLSVFLSCVRNSLGVYVCKPRLALILFYVTPGLVIPYMEPLTHPVRRVYIFGRWTLSGQSMYMQL